MNQEITITPAQIVQLFLWFCGAITAIGAAVAVIIKLVNAAKAPTKKLEERLAALEKKVEEHKGYFSNDNERLDILEEGNKVTQRALLALLSHGIDGNDVEGMRSAKAELQKYLIER
jgi:hypothetical protein